MAYSVLVTGATGHQGGSVVRALLDKGFGVTAMSRNPDGEKAKALKESGVEVVKGDFQDPDSLKQALSAVDAAFLVSTPFEAGIDAETSQGIAFIDAAAAAGVGFLLFSSVSDADRATGIPHFDSKYEVEKHLAKSGLDYAILAPAFFYDNMMAPFVLPGLKQGTLAQGLDADKELQSISVRDIGRFAALMLERRDEFKGRRVNVAGDSLTGQAYADALASATGRSIGYAEVPIDQIKKMSEDMGIMYDWFNREGYSADIDGLRSRYPEVGWERFDEWAARQDWSVLDD